MTTAAGPADLLARCRFVDPPAAVTCAVSGGADSLALLVLAVEAGLDVTAVHVDHGLRPGSIAEAERVAEAAERWGAAFVTRTVEVEDGPNLEARARAARYGVLPPGTLTGHTADDQAETVLLNLVRGAGLDGLRGIVADRRRPLLGLRRQETAALCRSVGLRPVEDPTNRDRRFRRNRVRHEVIPLLSDLADRDVAAVIARQAALVADDASYLDELATGIDPTDARAVASAPIALARRAIRHWLRQDHPPNAAAVERVLAVARGDAVATDVGAGARVVRSAQRLRLVAAEGRCGHSGSDGPRGSVVAPAGTVPPATTRAQG